MKINFQVAFMMISSEWEYIWSSTPSPGRLTISHTTLTRKYMSDIMYKNVHTFLTHSSSKLIKFK